MSEKVTYGGIEFDVRGMNRKEFVKYNKLEKEYDADTNLDEIEKMDQVQDEVFKMVLPGRIAEIDNLTWADAQDLYVKIMSLTSGRSEEDIKNSNRSGSGTQTEEASIAVPAENSDNSQEK